MSRGQLGPVDKIVRSDDVNVATDAQGKPARPVIFDVLTLRQQRLKSLLEDLEKRRVPAWVKKEIREQQMR